MLRFPKIGLWFLQDEKLTEVEYSFEDELGAHLDS